MKKILAFSAVMLLAAVPVSAKTIGPGTFEFSGDTELSYFSNTNEFKDKTFGDSEKIDTTTTKLSLSGSYYAIPNLGVGLLVSFETADTEGDKETATAIGPQVIYQFGLSEAANVFIAAAVGYNKVEAESDGESADADGFFWAVGGGLKFFPTNNFSVDAMIQYASHNYEDSDFEVEASGFGFGVGFSVYLP